MAPEFRQTAWIEHASDAGNDVAKTVQHDADPFFLHPLRVVAFLRKGPGIPLDDNGEAADHRFGDAAGSRLADKKVSRAHELMPSFVKPTMQTGKFHRRERNFAASS